jgi:hypothetical protein
VLGDVQRNRRILLRAEFAALDPENDIVVLDVP